MHGDDVASAGVEVSTQIVSKATELIMEMLKIAIDREREAKRLKQSEKSEVLSGGEVTYQKLKEGGEARCFVVNAKARHGRRATEGNRGKCYAVPHFHSVRHWSVCADEDHP